MDLISRQAAIDEINEMLQDTSQHDDPDISEIEAEAYGEGVRTVGAMILALPSAQSEIIRCKDCKCYVIHTLFGRSQGWCERLCDEFDRSLARGMEPDDFCSRAERRKND